MGAGQQGSQGRKLAGSVAVLAAALALTACRGSAAQEQAAAARAAASSAAPSPTAAPPAWHVTPGNGTAFTAASRSPVTLVVGAIPFTCAAGTVTVTGKVTGDGAPETPGTPAAVASITAVSLGQGGGCDLMGEPVTARITPGSAPFTISADSYSASKGARQATGTITGVSESVDTAPGAPVDCHAVVTNTAAGSAPLPVAFYDTPYTGADGKNYGPGVFVVNPGSQPVLRVAAVHGDATCTASIRAGAPVVLSGVFGVSGGHAAALSITG